MSESTSPSYNPTAYQGHHSKASTPLGSCTSINCSKTNPTRTRNNSHYRLQCCCSAVMAMPSDGVGSRHTPCSRTTPANMFPHVCNAARLHPFPLPAPAPHCQIPSLPRLIHLPLPPPTLPPPPPKERAHHSTSPVRFFTLSRRAMVNSSGLLLSASVLTARGASEVP